MIWRECGACCRYFELPFLSMYSTHRSEIHPFLFISRCDASFSSLLLLLLLLILLLVFECPRSGLLTLNSSLVHKHNRKTTMKTLMEQVKYDIWRKKTFVLCTVFPRVRPGPLTRRNICVRVWEYEFVWMEPMRQWAKVKDGWKE